MLKAWKEVKLSILLISITVNISFMLHHTALEYIR